jgi:membrane-associated phospholipid phosphatase
VSGTRTSKR